MKSVNGLPFRGHGQLQTEKPSLVLTQFVMVIQTTVCGKQGCAVSLSQLSDA